MRSHSRGLQLGSAAAAVALTVGFAGSISPGTAIGSDKPPIKNKIVHDPKVVEQITSDNPRIVTRAGTPSGAIKLTRASKKGTPKLAISKTAAKVTVTNWYKSKKKTKKSTKSKTLKSSSKWTVKLSKTSTKVRVSAPKFTARSFSVAAKKLNKTYAFKAVLPNGPNTAGDYTRLGTKDTFWDTCKYTVDGQGKVSSVTSAKEFTYSGLTGVLTSYRNDIKAGLAKITAVTGYTFTEKTGFTYNASAHPQNHIHFTVVNLGSGGSGWSISGFAGPVWRQAGPGAGQKWNLYLGGTAQMEMMTNAPSYARQLLAMHEVGHVLGLGHAKGMEQVMYPTILKDQATWGKGDMTGLREVGFKKCRFKMGESNPWHSPTFNYS